jgi:epoxyqueuosine reductase QueG
MHWVINYGKLENLRSKAKKCKGKIKRILYFCKECISLAPFNAKFIPYLCAPDSFGDEPEFENRHHTHDISANLPPTLCKTLLRLKNLSS